MKGPLERLKYNLRRLWTCPVCNRQQKTTGDVTTCICKCQEKEELSKQVCMTLTTDGPQRVQEAEQGHAEE